MPILQAIKDCTGLLDLEFKLRDLGYRFGSTDEYFDFIDENYKTEAERRLNDVTTEHVGKGLPDHTVGRFHLHGINHGTRERKVSEKVRKEIELASKDYFYEHGLNVLFDLDQKRGIYCKDFMTLGVILRSQKTDDKYRKMLLDIVEKTYSNVRFNHILNSFLMARSRPQPLDLEISYVDSVNTLRDNNLCIEEIGISTLNSFIASQNLRNKNQEEIHYLCGAAHVLEIAYFLQNPDYDFKHLDKYLRN